MGRQQATADGRGNIIVQAQGDNIHVEIGLSYLRLIAVERRVRTGPRREVDILNPCVQSVPLVGRDEDLAFLRKWLELESKRPILAV